MNAAGPTLATIGTTVAAMIAPGSISSMRRTRRVIGMWPISQ